MDQGLIVAIIAAVVALGAIFYARSIKPEAVANDKGFSFSQTLGAGIVGLGLLLVLMPWASGAIAALDFIQSSDFAILTGAAYTLGFLALLAGIALAMHKNQSDT